MERTQQLRLRMQNFRVAVEHVAQPRRAVAGLPEAASLPCSSSSALRRGGRRT